MQSSEACSIDVETTYSQSLNLVFLLHAWHFVYAPTFYVLRIFFTCMVNVTKCELNYILAMLELCCSVLVEILIFPLSSPSNVFISPVSTVNMKFTTGISPRSTNPTILIPMWVYWLYSLVHGCSKLGFASHRKYDVISSINLGASLVDSVNAVRENTLIRGFSQDFP